MIISLIFLVLLTFLGFESMSKGSIGLKVASNTSQKVVTFHSAENVRTAARAAAESMASTLGASPAPATAWATVDAQGRYNVEGALSNKDPAPAVGTRAFWNASANYAAVAGAAGVTSGYVIEYLGRQNLVPDANRSSGATVGVHVFRITINAVTGGSAATALQTIYVTNCGAAC